MITQNPSNKGTGRSTPVCELRKIYISMKVEDEIAKTIELLDDDNNVRARATVQQKFDINSSEIKIAPTIVEEGTLVWIGADAIFIIESLWDKIQKEQGIKETFAKKYGAAWSKLRRNSSKLYVKKISPDAVVPSKAHPCDTGFDITLIRVVNPNHGPNVVLYGTGLVVRPPDGYYLDLVARSSLSKTGWGVANSVGIIDAQYRGELCFCLTKLSNDAKPLELPIRAGQLIVRELHLVDVEEVDELSSTMRGAGGFGSSGK